MGINPTFGGQILGLILEAAAIANLADNAASSPDTLLYVSLHTADPATVAGAGSVATQNASEAAYTGYARVAINRNTGAWTITGNSISPQAPITFPIATGGPETETYIGIGTAASGTGKLLWSGALSSSLAVAVGTNPQLTTATSIAMT